MNTVSNMDTYPAINISLNSMKENACLYILLIKGNILQILEDKMLSHRIKYRNSFYPALTVFFLLILIQFNQIQADSQAESGQFTDSRDGQTYGWVKIAENYWMAENLNFDTSGSWNYNNDTANGAIYGLLYNWITAVNACPEGWHLPSEPEWTQLVNELGGISIAGQALKSTSGWDNNGNGDNSSNLSVLPAGFRNPDGSFIGIGWLTGFWTSTPNSSDHALLYLIPYDIPGVMLNGDLQTSGKSVRCITCCMTQIGDANGDGSVNVGDVVYLINHIFHDGQAPNPNAAGDANCDGSVNIGDGVYLINHIFNGGPEPCAGR